jgi:hypothetical protein
VGRLCARALLVAVVAASWLAGYSGAASGSVRRPKLLREDASSAFAVRPATMIFGDGEFFITGPRVSQHDLRARRDGHIRWSSWTQTRATGRGRAWVNNCFPSCTHSTSYSFSSVSIKASRVRSGRYTRLRVRYRLRGKRIVDHGRLRSLGRGVYYWG